MNLGSLDLVGQALEKMRKLGYRNGGIGDRSQYDFSITPNQDGHTFYLKFRQADPKNKVEQTVEKELLSALENFGFERIMDREDGHMLHVVSLKVPKRSIPEGELKLKLGKHAYYYWKPNEKSEVNHATNEIHDLLSRKRP